MPDLRTSRGQVIGFGRVKIPKMPVIGFNFEIPLLSFVITKRDDGRHIATCIHLQIDGYGKSMLDARNDMIGNIWDYLRETFNNDEKSAWDNITDLLMSNTRSSILWDKYHIMQIEDAKKGLPDHYSRLYENIKSLENKVNELEAELDKKEEYISAFLNKLISDGSLVMDYAEAA